MLAIRPPTLPVNVGHGPPGPAAQRVTPGSGPLPVVHAQQGFLCMHRTCDPPVARESGGTRLHLPRGGAATRKGKRAIRRNCAVIPVNSASGALVGRNYFWELAYTPLVSGELVYDPLVSGPRGPCGRPALWPVAGPRGRRRPPYDPGMRYRTLGDSG